MAKSNKTTVSKSTTKAVEANKEVIAAAIAPQTEQAAPESNKEVITSPAQTVKADKARTIFAEAYADPKNVPPRKAIIARMVAEAELTPAGAATYLQNMKKKAGFVQPRTKQEAPAEAPSA